MAAVEPPDAEIIVVGTPCSESDGDEFFSDDDQEDDVDRLARSLPERQHQQPPEPEAEPPPTRMVRTSMGVDVLDLD